jgi:hypothetical protein
MAMSNVGPIIFANEHARKKLVETGYVITFRATERTTGQTWWRASRTGEKRGDCEVAEFAHVDPSDEMIDELAEAAGFAHGDAWRAAIRDHHGDPDSGILYEVVENTKQYVPPAPEGDR